LLCIFQPCCCSIDAKGGDALNPGTVTMWPSHAEWTKQ
jgi:hypothetical protein